MPRSFLTDDAKAAFNEAIATVERRSSAELVVAVRPRSGSYLRVPLAVGAVTAMGTLAALLFVPTEFDLLWFLVDPVLAAVAAAAVAWRFPVWTRLFTREEARRRQVITEARALFVEKHLHQTRGRTGILFYVSLLERLAVLVPDIAVEPLAAEPGWQQVVARLDEAMGRGADGVEVAARLGELAAVLEGPFPCPHDDIDELSNEVM